MLSCRIRDVDYSLMTKPRGTIKFTAGTQSIEVPNSLVRGFAKSCCSRLLRDGYDRMFDWSTLRFVLFQNQGKYVKTCFDANPDFINVNGVKVPSILVIRYYKSLLVEKLILELP